MDNPETHVTLSTTHRPMTNKTQYNTQTDDKQNSTQHTDR